MTPVKPILQTIGAIIAITILLLFLKKPIEWLLNSRSADTLKNDFVAGIISRLGLIGFAIAMIRRLRLQRINGLYRTFHIKNLQALLLPLALVGAVIVSKLDVYQSARLDLLLAFTCSVLVIGVAEELIFRGIVFPLFIKMNASQKGAVTTSALLSSLLFGLMHYINLFREPHNFDGITSQVIFAFSLGVFFAGLFIRTENIVLVALIHAGINFAFGSGQLLETPVAKPEMATDWASLLFGLLLHGLVVASGLLMMYWSKPADTLAKLTDRHAAEYGTW